MRAQNNFLITRSLAQRDRVPLSAHMNKKKRQPFQLFYHSEKTSISAMWRRGTFRPICSPGVGYTCMYVEINWYFASLSARWGHSSGSFPDSPCRQVDLGLWFIVVLYRHGRIQPGGGENPGGPDPPPFGPRYRFFNIGPNVVPPPAPLFCL